jgi:hypothetical protein
MIRNCGSLLITNTGVGSFASNGTSPEEELVPSTFDEHRTVSRHY